MGSRPQFPISQASPGIGISRHQPRCLGVARSAAAVLGPVPAASSDSDRWTYAVIFNLGEAGLGE